MFIRELNKDYTETEYLQQFSLRVEKYLEKMERMSKIFENIEMPAAFTEELKAQTERLKETRKLSISRGFLREAFRVLESRGIIKSKLGGGRYIREIRKNEHNNTENIILSLEKSSILELLEAREIFEVKIAEIATQRTTLENIEIIEEALNKMNQKEELKDEKKTESDTEFHLVISGASHNFVFVNTMKLHLDLIKETREKTWQISGRREKQYQEQQAIFQAIKEHNSKKAGEAMLKHLRNIREIVVGI